MTVIVNIHLTKVRNGKSLLMVVDMMELYMTVYMDIYVQKNINTH